MHNPEDRSFIGHPRGLAYIAFTEAWERFSYYGMQALLVLYMVNRLLHPGHIEHVAGFGPFRHLIESFRGPLSVQALASTIFGLYTGLVYLTPIAGGFIADRKYLPPDSPVVEKSASAPKPRLSKRERTAILVLLLLLPVLTIAVIGNQQIFNAYLVWAQDHANLVCFGYQLPTTWLITLDSILSVSCLAGAVVFWRLWSKKYPEPAEITKISIGSLIAVTGFLSLAAGTAIAASTGVKVPIGWLITFHLLNSIGFANVFPVSLALYARVAPATLSATIIGIYYLAFFAANNLVGWIGGFLEKMPAANFWLLHSALCATAGIIFFIAGRFFGHLLAPGDNESGQS